MEFVMLVQIIHFLIKMEKNVWRLNVRKMKYWKKMEHVRLAKLTLDQILLKGFAFKMLAQMLNISMREDIVKIVNNAQDQV